MIIMTIIIMTNYNNYDPNYDNDYYYAQINYNVMH